MLLRKQHPNRGFLEFSGTADMPMFLSKREIKSP